MELCGKILDACASQQVDFQVHCGAALVLLAPLVAPWRVRERVWRHFGELRVLHLLEDAALLEGLLPLLDAAPDGPGAAPAATAARTSSAPSCASSSALSHSTSRVQRRGARAHVVRDAAVAEAEHHHRVRHQAELGLAQRLHEGPRRERVALVRARGLLQHAAHVEFRPLPSGLGRGGCTAGPNHHSPKGRGL